MRIVHFSDFHLRADRLDRATNIVKKLLSSLKDIHLEKNIDLILFTGDMIDKGGDSFEYPKITNALKKFEEVVINPITKGLNIPQNRFIFTIGNHEIDRDKINNDEEEKLTNELCSHEKVDLHILNTKSPEPRIEEYNAFRDAFWGIHADKSGVFLTPFQYGVKLNINGQMVGVNCLNTAWRCHLSETDEHKIVVGKSQITNMRDFFEDCHIKLAIGHHHPNAMNQFEINTLSNLLAWNYDAYLCGHTHNNNGEYISKPQGGFFMLTASGTLSGNESAENKYRNGFVVIDYNLDNNDIDTQCYFQNENTDFEKDLNFGTNGIWHFPIPGSRVLKPMKVSLFRQQRYGEFLKNDIINDILQKLKDDSNKTIHFVALSGLGKTRILREAFDDGTERPNHFYCEYADDKNGLLYDIESILTQHKGQNGVIVLDNCPNAILEKAIEKRDVYSPNFRIVGINNEFYDRQNLAGIDIKQIFLTQDDVRNMVNEYIEQRIPINNGDQCPQEQIKKIADGFPGMAIIMVQEYLKEKPINVHIVDHIVKKMLKFEDNASDDQEIVMRSLALFQPFPYAKECKEAYKFIRENEEITPLYGKSSAEKKRLFTRTINSYNNSIIEITQNWLNVRPFPLAVWLVEKWFENGVDEECIESIISQIQELDSGIYTVIRDGLYKRLEYMQDSIPAQDMIMRLTGIANAPFCNEKVLCSDLGSRLFLAMVSVNPGATVSCLHRTLMPKDIKWIKDNIVGDVRRNLVWALEKLCFCKESYRYGSEVMALFAVAENETWANNAEGQFVQLFHIMLPGTEATLCERIETLKYLKSLGKPYELLALKSLDRAFDNGSFSRGGEGSHFGNKRRIDYRPQTTREIIEYWEQSRDILIAWVCEDPSITDRVAELIVNHVQRWALDGMLVRVFPLIKVVASQKGESWEAMYMALSKVANRLFVYPPEFQQEIKEFNEGIRPASFNQRLKDARVQIYDKYKLDIASLISYEQEVFTTLAREFLEQNIYTNKNEIRKIILDKEYHDIYFSMALSEIITDAQLEKMLNIFIEIIAESQDDDFRSPFVSRICYVFREKKPMRLFFNQLYLRGCKISYVRFIANGETSQLDSYQELKNKILSRELPSEVIDEYLQYASLSTMTQICTVIQTFYYDFTDRLVSLMRFICLHRFDMDILLDMETYKVVKEVILAYPISEDNPQINYEFAGYVSDVLKNHYDASLAVSINKKLIEELNYGYFSRNFEGIYTVLLTKYSDYIWPEFENAFIDDGHYGFLYQIKEEIGSGTTFSAGVLFQTNDAKVREMCHKHPLKAPFRVAELVPIFDNNKFSEWVIWLIDNFGDQKEVLDGLHANMETYAWTGSVVPIIEQKKRCLQNIIGHEKLGVRVWAELYLRELDEDLNRELNREEYMRLHYS